MSYDFNIEHLHDMSLELDEILYDMYGYDDAAYDNRRKVQELKSIIMNAIELANELDDRGIFE